MATTSPTVELATSVSERDHMQGPPSALVTLVEYGDYECPHCAAAHLIIKEVQQRLGDQLRFVYRHLPITHIHPHAFRAAEAAEAAATQGLFWEMHDHLFTHQQALDANDLSHYAQHLGLDRARFDQEMAERMHEERIREDHKQAIYVEHITGTPTLYINGVRYDDTANAEGILGVIKLSDPTRRIEITHSRSGWRRLFS